MSLQGLCNTKNMTSAPHNEIIIVNLDQYNKIKLLQTAVLTT